MLRSLVGSEMCIRDSKCFWDLSSLEPDARHKATAELIQTLEQHKAHGEYCLKRLVRGLGSAREAARQGFATALAELLTVDQEMDLGDVVSMIHECHPVGSKSGGGSQQERDALFGRVFGLMAVVRSGRCDAEAAEAVIDSAATLMNSKSYMPPVVVAVLVELVDRLGSDLVPQLVDPLKRVLDLPPEEYNASLLQLLLHLHLHHMEGEAVLEMVPRWRGITIPILSAENMDKLSAALMDSSTPTVHPVWDYVLHATEDKAGQAFLRRLWSEVVDSGLMLSSHERKAVGFDLAERMLGQMKPRDVPVVLSSAVLSCAVNSLKNPEAFLHDRAKKFADTLSKVPETNPSLHFPLLCELSQRVNFDKVTKTGTVQALLSQLDGSGVDEYAEFLRSMLLECDSLDSNADVDRQRIWSLESMLALMRNSHIPKSEEAIQRAGQHFLMHSFFSQQPKSKKTPKKKARKPPGWYQAAAPAVSSKVQEVGRRCFFSMLAELCTSSKQREDGQSWVWLFVQDTEAMRVCPELGLFQELGEEQVESREAVLKLVKQLGDDSAQARAWQQLLSHMLMQQLTDPTESTPVLDELVQCHLQAKEELDGGQKMGRAQEDDEETEPCSMEVLVDILLSLLLKPSQLIREVVKSVMSAIAPDLSRTALGLVVRVVASTDQRQVMAVEDSDMEDEEEDEEEEEGRSSGTVSYTHLTLPTKRIV
eukprot:TRINITY_DN6269_c0_g1_i1.p1 TRINITY_DN6269_c0_g1~~TRINITY_DN6269_c0_g1_i1.p1  ORF type:complete len:707 (+),score=208.11 TRINITY_DN6269_c0_g1_i1:72-2192(+)